MMVFNFGATNFECTGDGGGVDLDADGDADATGDADAAGVGTDDAVVLELLVVFGRI